MKNAKQEFVSALFNARNRIRFSMDDKFKPLGVTDATWRALFYLDQVGDGVQQKELARVMGIEGPSLVRLLDNLESKKLIVRKMSKEDRRSKTIHLTKTSSVQLVSMKDTAADVRNVILKDISKSDLAVCTRVLKTIIDTTNEMGEQDG